MTVHSIIFIERVVCFDKFLLICFRADGQYLNYDAAIGSEQFSTDIHRLCQFIVESQKKQMGQYTAVSNH